MMATIDELTAATTARKRGGLTLSATTKDEKTKVTLTPVGVEAGGARIPDVPEVFLTNEAVADVAVDLRRQAALLIDAAEGLERLTQTGQADKAPDPALERKLLEREADRQAADREAAAAGDKRAAARVDSTPSVAEFADRFDRLSKEAQEATFKGDFGPAAAEVFADAASGSPVTGWECPTHGAEALKESVGKRTGRKFLTCTICNQFQKG